MIAWISSDWSSSIWNTVSLNVDTAFIQDPKQERSIRSKSSPRFSLITVAPVNKAKSSNISFLFTPCVGAGLHAPVLFVSVWYYQPLNLQVIF